MPYILFQGAFLGYNLIMSYKYSVIKDNPIGFWFLDEQSGTTATDISGCGNNGTYLLAPSTFPLPLTYGGINSVEITSSQSIDFPLNYDYNGINRGTPIANKDYSYNSFSIETFIYPKSLSSSLQPVVADTSKGIGLFINNNGITFVLNGLGSLDYRLDCNVLNFERAIHVVCIYSINNISIYIDGEEKISKQVEAFNFVNSTLNLKAGPTSNSSDKFLIDSVAVYRYPLSSDQIKKHYNLSQSIGFINVTIPDQAEIFNIYDNNISTKFEYSYPANKSWEEISKSGLEYNYRNNTIGIPSGSGESQSIFFEDFIFIPSAYNIDSSKIEWVATSGVSVYTSIDGSTYVQCDNNSMIPQYGNINTTDTFDESYRLYIKVLFETSNDKTINPTMESLTVKFYGSHILYAVNSNSSISQIINDDLYPARAYVANQETSFLSRNKIGGISSKTDSGFALNIKNVTKSIEFFYTPKDLSTSGLIYRPDIVITELSGGLYNTSYSGLQVIDGGVYNSTYSTTYDAGNALLDAGVFYGWSSNGIISKNNIFKIYVNSVDKTSATNVSNVFSPGEISHVVIVLEDEIMNTIKLNYSLDGSNEAEYQYISLYGYELDQERVSEHYQVYINGDPTVISEPSFSLTENSVEAFDNDWLVIQNV